MTARGATRFNDGSWHPGRVLRGRHSNGQSGRSQPTAVARLPLLLQLYQALHHVDQVSAAGMTTVFSSLNFVSDISNP